MEEIWKDIPEYEGLYQVSNLGRIKSLDRIIKRPKMGDFLKKGKIMSGVPYKGYINIILSKNGIYQSFKVHRLVAKVFLNKKEFKSMPNEDRDNIDLNKLEVNHKNENKSDNRVENLEYCTRNYNMLYGNCQIKKVLHTDYSFCRKIITQYDLQNNLIKIWRSVSEAQKELKISHISDCCKGKRKTAGGYVWRYVNK